MNKYKIAFIDENGDELGKVQRRLSDMFIVNQYFPKENIEEFVNELLSIDVDAFLIDFQLNEYRAIHSERVNYTGSDLLSNLLSIRKDFPCFILTSYDQEAILKTHNVNFVYSKSLLNPSMEGGNLDLNLIVSSQIDHYKSLLEESNKKFQELLQIPEEDLTSAQEDELLRLDTFLEASLNFKDALLQERKSKIVLGKVENLLQVSEELLTQLRKHNSK
jgi:hypothetical protein